MLIVGVDSGATHTRALAAREDGTPVGSAASGPGNPHNIGPGPAAAEIARSIREAASGETPDVVVAGVAGLEDPELQRELRYALEALRPAGEIHLYSDAAIALDGAFLGGPGVIVIAGTGSVAWGRNEKGREARAGGWGHIIDDNGSGFDLGRQALAASLRAYDGRGPQTALTQGLVEALGVEGPLDFPGVARRLDTTRMASLARVVVEVADRGDAVARTIVRNAASQLATLATAVWKNLNLAHGHTVAPVGGLFTHARLRKAFASSLSRRCPEAEVKPPRLPPVAGAVWRAAVRKGLTPSETMVVRLEGWAQTAEESR